MSREKRVQIERKFFMVKGPKELALCLKNEETEGWVLTHIVWSGNIEVDQVPGQIVTKDGEGMKRGLIHLYLVMLKRETELKGPERIM